MRHDDVLRGLFGGALNALMVALAMWLAASGTRAAAASFAGPEACAGCHQVEYDEWKDSKHAKAFSEMFTAFWKERNNNPTCLVCHTTGFEPEQGTYALKGVSCESCHGPLNPAHPEGGQMTLPTDSTMCMQCHRQTFVEWQLSGHAKHNIRCFDCHAVHRQGLRQEHIEDQCGACHVERLEDFAHATHHLQGLTCATCHMTRQKTSGIGGTGAPSHSFFVGAETCAACHEETVHRSHKMKNTLGEQVERLTKQSDDQTTLLEAKGRQLELELDIAKSRTIKIALGALLAGLLLGAFGQGARGNKRNGIKRGDGPHQST